jgi:prefoldin subunit 5
LPERMGVPTYRATDLQVEKEVLQSQLNALQAELDLVKRRLSELDAAPTTGKEIGETRP